MPVPPFEREAEEEVLGALLVSESATEVFEILKASDFYNEAHIEIYSACQDLFEEGIRLEPVAVLGRLRERGSLEDIGGGSYLHMLVATMGTAESALFHAKMIAEAAQLRELINHCTILAQAAYGREKPAQAILADAESRLLDLVGARERGSLERIETVMEDTLASFKEDSGYFTGFAKIDSLIDGLKPGQLVIVGGRPASGKTTLALNIAAQVALGEELPVAMFSMEMSAPELVGRLLASEAEIPHHRLQRHNIDLAEESRLKTARKRLESAPLWIDDQAMMTPGEIRSRVRRLSAKAKPVVVVVDYLQLMTAGRRTESRVQEVSELSRQLKVMAKELECVMLVCSQLNRVSVSEGKPRRPRLSDLRESGSIEQDADVVLLVHQPWMYSEKAAPFKAEVLVEKNRNGPVGMAHLTFRGPLCRFEDMGGV